MKYLLNICLAILISSCLCSGQDAIFRMDGKIIYGKITKVDSNNVYITTLVKSTSYETFINREKIKSIKYGIESNTKNNNFNDGNNLIYIEQHLGGQEFYYDGREINVQKLKKILKTDTDSYAIFEKTLVPSGFADALAISGGFLIGYSLGDALFANNKSFNWTYLGIGLASATLSFPINSYVINKRKIAVHVFNNSIIQKGNKGYNEEIKMSFTGSGICFHF